MAALGCLAAGMVRAEDVPAPVGHLMNVPALPWSSFHHSVVYSTDGLLYLWDGSYVWQQDGVGVDGFTQIGEVPGNMADAGPIRFSPDGTQFLLGNGAGGWGPMSGEEYHAGRLFGMPIGGAVLSQPLGDIDYHYDIATLPSQSTIAQPGQKFFINFGWENYMNDPKSWVSVFDAATGMN
ncbi:MAG: hypothetical protein JW818_17135, partial [Pirellulales bacterium]|nr:hypothetical protein [Pirellulales bacterium]